VFDDADGTVEIQVRVGEVAGYSTEVAVAVAETGEQVDYVAVEHEMSIYVSFTFGGAWVVIT